MSDLLLHIVSCYCVSFAYGLLRCSIALPKRRLICDGYCWVVVAMVVVAVGG
ncbi:hypothetical protein BVRB_8g201070 [Beta vulgaris subsp. vulgaris]|uniref:Uncharacterized protein n=1 Tax=Beta vulgaris subsp. vulgaris TaxID=3555 RepID=A0A0J8B5X8_BETVV|nr:hypothetical protein BVRB_8g201070 [Beta vulgaris subsp. vulgaris]